MRRTTKASEGTENTSKLGDMSCQVPDIAEWRVRLSDTTEHVLPMYLQNMMKLQFQVVVVQWPVSPKKKTECGEGTHPSNPQT